MTIKFNALSGASALVLAVAFASTGAAAQEAVAEAAAADDADRRVQPVDEIVVQGEIGYRNRTDATEPTLEYGEEYFQRFEPVTAGDALKRVPSVTFLSDVIESDGARLRGLDPGYTQLLINGERVPGANADRSFFLDRVPAELIDRVEIVRSSSARRTGDAIAGTLNIVLRDGYSIDGGYVRGGALRFDDATLKETAGVFWGGEAGPGRLLLGANVQGRYNPKQKSSLRYSDSPENDPDFATNAFDNREDQTDTRDGRDYSFNANYDIRLAGGDELEFDGFLVYTDRSESERSFEYDDPSAITGPVPAGNLLTDNIQRQDITQTSYSASARYERDILAGRAQVKATYAVFEESRDDREEEIDFDRSTPRFTGDFTDTELFDREIGVELEHVVPVSDGVDIAFGAFWQTKGRSTDIREQRNRFNVTSGLAGYIQFLRTPNEFTRAYSSLQPTPGSVNRIDEDRLDGFVLIEGANSAFGWEAGLRYESTDVTVEDLTGAAAAPIDASYGYLLPSAHVKFDVTPVDRITISGARTLRRPNFNFLSPATLEGEFGDNDFVGDPTLQPETAWGGDIGYERRLGKKGVVGVNFFYRAVQDLVEVTTVLDSAGNPLPGVNDSPSDRAFVLTAANIGDGDVYGVEFDLSTPLGFIGLDDTGVFANASYLESEIDDIFGSRRFNDQSKFVYNVGFIQDLPSLAGSFGATYRKQGNAFGRLIGEEVTTRYGADLEVFVEKRFADVFTLRFVGSNLLNGTKDEDFNKFVTIADQQSRSFDEYELESEQAGPWFQLVGRYAF